MQPVRLQESEIRKLFEAFVTERKNVKRTNRTETTKTTGGSTQPDSKAFTHVKNRTLEALKARGFADGEANQMVERLMARGGEAGTVETLIREIEKTEFIQELNIRLPHEAATVFRQMQTPLKENEIALFENGTRQVFEVDLDVARAFKAMDAETANLFVKLIAIPAQTLLGRRDSLPGFYGA